MRRIVPAILLIALLVIGGGIIANTAYQAGLSTAVTTAAANGATVVAPVPAYGYGYGYGWHPFGFGFGIFGFVFGLFFLFLIFGLLRAIFWGGRRGWGPAAGVDPVITATRAPAATRGSTASDRASRNGTARRTSRGHPTSRPLRIPLRSRPDGGPPAASRALGPTRSGGASVSLAHLRATRPHYDAPDEDHPRRRRRTEDHPARPRLPRARGVRRPRGRRRATPR